MRIVASELPLFSKDIEASKKRKTRIHWHRKHELYYLVNGTTKYFVGEKPYFLQKGNLIFVQKGAQHGTDYEDCLHSKRLLLSFDDDIIPQKFKPFFEELSTDCLIYISEKHLPLIDDIFKKIELENQSQNLYKQHLIELYILQLITLISRLREKAPQPQLAPNDALMYKISNYIRKNYHTNISLESLSESFCINKSYLSRRFKGVFGIGVNDYLTYIRILHAEELLKTTNYPITRIAAECGYNDSNYFSTVFKKTKGITPYKFKQSLKQD